MLVSWTIPLTYAVAVLFVPLSLFADSTSMSRSWTQKRSLGLGIKLSAEWSNRKVQTSSLETDHGRLKSRQFDRWHASQNSEDISAPCLALRGGTEDGEKTEVTEGLESKEVKAAARGWGLPSDQSLPHNYSQEEAIRMENEVIAFLQRAASILQGAGGRMDSTIFAKQWSETYPEDPLTAEQVVTAVASILKESGYFHVEESTEPTVKIFELIEQSEDGAGLEDVAPTLCLPFELAPPEEDRFLDKARDWLSVTGVGRHPAVGSGLMTDEELTAAINPADPPPPGVTRRRHDEVEYTSKWSTPLVGYWTLGPCEGSNGCIHGSKVPVGVRHHWTCCGCTDIRSVFCLDHGGGASPVAAAAAAATGAAAMRGGGAAAAAAGVWGGVDAAAAAATGVYGSADAALAAGMCGGSAAAAAEKEDGCGCSKC